MITVFSQKDAFAFDELTITSKHSTERELMDNAGRSIAQFIVETIEDPFNQKFIVLSGPGNNGGDAIISHYYLNLYGVQSELLLLNEKQKQSWIFKQYSIDADTLGIYSDECRFNPEYWYVDGIFGIGLKRTVEGRYKDVIDKLSDCPNMIAIDIPSGIYCDTGTIAGTNLQAEYTLTMGHPKLAHFFNEGLEYSGDLHVLDIGFKQLSKTQDYIQIIEPEDAGNISPVHSENSNKYSRGKLISIAGASGYTGACILAVQAAGKTGAGIIKAIIPESLNSIFETALIETITIPIPDNNSGYFSLENTADILKEVQWADAILFGPGLAAGKKSAEWMADILKKIQQPLVMDASGFLPLIEKKIQFGDLPPETILTPHYAEFSRIFNMDVKKVWEDPISAVREIISILGGRVLILKGATNIIVTSQGELLLMNYGTPLLATAGTGDVLSGILASAVVQGLSVDDAAIFGTFLHADCANQYEELTSIMGLTATDLLLMIPYALESLKYVH